MFTPVLRNLSAARSFGLLAALALVVPPALAVTEMTREFDLAPGGALVVEASGASVTVRGADGSKATVTLRAKRGDLDDYRIDVGVEGDTLRVDVRRPRSWRSLFGGSGDGLSIDIVVPRRTPVGIDTSGGALDVQEIDADVALDTSGGRITVRRIRGDLEADTSGGSIHVEAIRGRVALDTSGGSIEAVDIEGPLAADTSGGSIAVRRVTGDASLETSGGSITVEQAGGRVEADTSGGSIRASFAEGNDAGGSLETSAGSITIEVDPAVGLDLDLAASGGRVTTELDVTSHGMRSSRRLVGKLGNGGSKLVARTSAGSITLRGRSIPR